LRASRRGGSRNPGAISARGKNAADRYAISRLCRFRETWLFGVMSKRASGANKPQKAAEQAAPLDFYSAVAAVLAKPASKKSAQGRKIEKAD
jgi:hypothetical protein